MATTMNPTVFIRYQDTGQYYTRFAVRGRRYLWCTKTNDKRIAQMRAKQYRDAIVTEQYGLADGMKTGGGACTFEQLFAAFDALPTQMTQRSRVKAKSSMLRVLAASGLGPKDRVDRIGRDTVLAYQRQQLGGIQVSPGGSNGLKTQPSAPVAPSTITSTNATVAHSRILFSRRALTFYPDDLNLPRDHVAAYMAVPAVPNKNQTIRPLPDPAAMARAEDPKTGLPQHKAEWAAYLLAKYAGMRPIEIIAARWDWLNGEGIGVGGMDGVAKTKTGRFRFVNMSTDVMALIRLAKTDDTFIAGPHPKSTLRYTLPVMLRAYGFTMADPIYSLRRWHASWRYENQGAPSAQDALGHTTPSTTMRHYARMFNAPAAIPLGGGAVVAMPSGPVVPSQ